MRYAIMAVALLGLPACADRSQPGGSLLDPLCMPGGGVVLWEFKRGDGSFDETTAKKENCPWYKPPARS
ncbi:MAG: hypothetical protein ACK58T_40570 [Phycisphaerae bacterium]